MWNRLRGSLLVIGVLVSLYFITVLIHQKALLDATSILNLKTSMVWSSEYSAKSPELHKLLILAYPRWEFLLIFHHSFRNMIFIMNFCNLPFFQEWKFFYWWYFVSLSKLKLYFWAFIPFWAIWSPDWCMVSLEFVSPKPCQGLHGSPVWMW